MPRTRRPLPATSPGGPVTRPARPALPVLLALLVLLGAVMLSGCGAGGSGGGSMTGVVTGSPAGGGGSAVPPASPRSAPAPMPDPSGPALPTPTIGVPVSGQRERAVSPTLVSVAGADLVVQVVSGGPPCEAVTGLEVAESPTEVKVTAWVGRSPGAAGCDGPRPAIAAIQWVRVTLAAPLGTRPFVPAVP